MTIELPEIRSNFEGFASLTDFAAKTNECDFETVTVDFSNVAWFDANMSAPLGVLFTRLTEDLNSVRPVHVPARIQKILAKNLFLVGYGFPECEDDYGTTIPYRRFQPEDSRYFVSYLNKHLEGKGIPMMTEGLGRRFKDSILEIFVNSAMHSESKFGIFACGQFFPAQQRLDFSVADAGIGIRRKIRKELGLVLNSDKAIQWALEEGNTTRKGAIPGGLGLKLLREFVALNGGCLQIVSDRGFWESRGGQESVQRFEHPFPGTVINLEINTADVNSYRLSSEREQSS